MRKNTFGKTQEQNEGKLKQEGQDIEKVEKIKYLGVWINS